jgi:phytoene desaturase
MKRVAVIGSGFAGLSAACSLAKEGYEVVVFEKNPTPGGRARKFEADGFNFDMGPSWYWMPEVFENFFNQFGKTTSDFYQLIRLDPSYRIFFGENDLLDLPAGALALQTLFESMETGAGKKLERFLREGKDKYEIGMNSLAHKPGISMTDFLDPVLLKDVFRLHVFQSISSYVRKFFADPRIIKILEFPVLFLGAKPEKTPALYSLMNYADMSLGTWYPLGGMYKVIEAIVAVAKSINVTFRFNAAVTAIETEGKRATGLVVHDQFEAFDYIVAGADYRYVEQTLLPKRSRVYSPEYWDARVLAPSSLIFFLGIDKRIDGLLHHTLFFDEDFQLHASEIYDDPKWPTSPQFYVSCPSKTDDSVAPAGCENLMILIPVAPALVDDNSIRENYFEIVINRLENLTRQNIRSHIVFKRSYAHRDFIADYNSFKGNAYGLANTLRQTANFKPSIINKKVTNLFYTGQLTVPGPGVPPSIISGQLVARELVKRDKKSKHISYEGIIR